MLRLRLASADDEHLVLGWRNEAVTRAASFNSDVVATEDHHRWFSRKLDDPNCALLIVEENGAPVGQVRLDRVALDLAEISIGLAREVRGRGLGREALRQAVLEAHRLLSVRRLTAYVKQENAVSLAAFTAAGFNIIDEEGDVVELLYARQIDPSSG